MIATLGNLLFALVSIASSVYALYHIWRYGLSYTFVLIFIANILVFPGYIPRSVYYVGSAFFGWTPETAGFVIRYSQPFASASSSFFSVGSAIMAKMLFDYQQKEREGLL